MKKIVGSASVLILFLSNLAFGEDHYRYGISEIVISPTMMDTYEDSNGNSKWDKDEPWFDTNGDGKFNPYFLAGFSQNRQATRIHDDLMAIASSITLNRKRIVILTLDTIGWFHDDYKDIEAKVKANFDVDFLMVQATHNHEGPDTIGLWGKNYFSSGVNREWMTFIKNQSYQVIAQAIAQEKEASLHMGELSSIPGVGLADTRPIPEVIDRRVPILQFRDLQTGLPLGTIINFSNHVETLWAGNLEITADFPGYARNYISHGTSQFSGTGAPTQMIIGNIGGLTSTTHKTPVIDDMSGEAYIEPSFEKADVQGRVIANAVLGKIADQGLFKSSAILRVHRHEYRLKVQNSTYVAAAKILRIMKRKVKFDFGWWVETESNLLEIGDASLMTVPGELYPEIAWGGIVTDPGSDFQETPEEFPPLGPLMPGKIKMFANTANDFLGYIIPRSQWDSKEPWLGGGEGTYGESNSLGPKTGPDVHSASLNLIRSATATYLPFAGEYLVETSQGHIKDFKVDRLGKISGIYQSQTKDMAISGYGGSDGSFVLWLTPEIKLNGYFQNQLIFGETSPDGSALFEIRGVKVK